MNVLNYFLSFGSLVFVFVSGWFLVEGFNRFSFWVAGSDALAVFVRVFGWLLFAIVGYWFIFILWNIFKGLMLGKEGKFEY